MNILHVASTMDPAAGGPTRLLADLVHYQLRAGHHVTLCTTDRGTPQTKVLGRSAVATLTGPEVELQCFPVTFAPLLYSPAMSFWLRGNLGRFDIVHIHGLYRLPQTLAARAARRAEIPYIVTPHGALDPYLYGRSSRSVALKRLYERWFEFPNLHAAAGIHFTAEEEKSRAAFLGLRAPGFVVPAGLDWGRFMMLPARGGLRAAFGLGDAPVILFLGRLHAVKGLDLLIPAFDQLHKRAPGARLAIVGPDNDGYGKEVRRWVRERALEERVVFVDMAEGEALLQAFVDADVFVLPSYTENFGMTVIEALGCATPVIISDRVNIHREVAASGAGLVTPCDAAALFEAMWTLIEVPERRAMMGEAGRRWVKAQFSWPGIVERLDSEYHSAIGRQIRGQGTN